MSMLDTLKHWRGKERRRHETIYVAVSHELSESTQSLIEQLIEAVKDNGSGDNSAVLTAIQQLDRKVESMSSNIERIEQEATDLAEDAVTIKQALADLKTLVADLRTQVEQGQIDQARLDAAATKLEKVDDDLDSLTVTPESGDESGDGGAGTVGR